MSTTPHAPASSAAPAAHAPTSVKTYLIVFGWLAVMTAIEVGIAAAGLPENIRIILLIVLAVIKAALVVLYYMHLLHDSKWYWILLIAPIFFVLMLTQFLIVR
jgi:cytochrome c oxidase subunit 4